ncbi:MAG: leucine--tRNA ligase [Parcubacteria group bacterium CG1_02_41_12]|nr:MAG: leucine--tRNA ligase [Parcubacteria group bacterium CG1_02_41_12]
MSIYDHKSIEKKWQQRWEKERVFEVKDEISPPVFRGGLKGGFQDKKRYVLDMFPYPSGQGLHVGHPEGYTATDIFSRYLRMNGYQVLHPMGWDAFGLPAENYAIKIGVHPKKSMKDNIATFTRQLKSFGFSYDWSREVSTCDPEYYKWTQWLFLQFYKQGLAYKKEAPVNWCDSCKTVLANEQVVNGACERCHNEVVQKDLEQWFFKITDEKRGYPDRLLKNLDDLDWPEPIKLMQRNWIGRSEGAKITFPVVIARSPVLGATRQSRVNRNEHGIAAIANTLPRNDISVFTTRPDTLFGATYMVLAPEHKLVHELRGQISNWDEIEKYRKVSASKRALERTDLAKEKSGVELKGVKAINPANNEEIPVWIADYVLSSYGTGAIMAVPGHDERDFEFAKKFGLEIREVIKTESELPSIGAGKMINSAEFDGMESEEAKEKITKKVGGEMAVQYKLRDWLISRQRYWGAPIPIIYCDKCGEQPVDEKDLPVLLPDDVDFRPHGESPLARSESFQKVVCPKCGAGAKRESDTMDTFVDSSWYFLRYTDPKNNKKFADKKKIKTWLPVDTYVGGAEHAVMHLMYARFFCMALKDIGLLNFEEPFTSLHNQGLIMGPDGQKMSKSRGNVINPDEVVGNLGADTVRMYEMFMGPLEDSKPWDTDGIVGVRRFVERVWGMLELQNPNAKCQIKSKCQNSNANNNNSEINIEPELHKTIKKVQEDIESFSFNTAISQMMIFVNTVYKTGEISREHFETFLKILNPFAPHVTNELWEMLGHKNLIEKEKWPEVDVLLLSEDKINYVVQVNGKLRGSVEMEAGAAEYDVAQAAQKDENVAKHLSGKKIVKQIFVEGRLINFVVK